MIPGINKCTVSGLFIINNKCQKTMKYYIQKTGENNWQLRILQPDKLPFKSESNFKTSLNQFS
jgi:hypothetical protein